MGSKSGDLTGALLSSFRTSCSVVCAKATKCSPSKELSSLRGETLETHTVYAYTVYIYSLRFHLDTGIDWGRSRILDP